MALELRCWKFSKRENSTKIPASSPTVFNVVLKAPCSMDTPVFLINAESFDFNFCQYAGNGHYYWITDITSERNDLWSVACAVDVLATFKDEIQATTAWVQYSSQSYNLNIVDKRLPTPLGVTTFFTEPATPTFDEDGFYVLCAAGVGYSGNTGGFTQMYGMSASRLISLAERFFTLDDFITDIRDYFRSPYDSVVEVYWVPFVMSKYGGGDDTIYLGNYNMGINGEAIVQRNSRDVVTMTITHPYGDFRDAFCCSYTLYLPFYGYIDINAQDLYGFTTMTVEIVTDLYDGGVVYKIYASNESGNQVSVGTYGVNVKGSIPVGQGTGLGNFTSIAGFITGNTLPILALGTTLVERTVRALGGFGSFSSITEDLYTTQPKASGSFSGTAMAKLKLNVELAITYRNTTESPTAQNAIRGNACGKTLSLGSLSGYVQTAGASVSIDGELDHARRINAYLDGGVYLE